MILRIPDRQSLEPACGEVSALIAHLLRRSPAARPVAISEVWIDDDEQADPPGIDLISRPGLWTLYDLPGRFAARDSTVTIRGPSAVVDGLRIQQDPRTGALQLHGASQDNDGASLKA